MDGAIERLGLEDDSRDEFPWEEFTERERAAFERYEEAKAAAKDGR